MSYRGRAAIGLCARVQRGNQAMRAWLDFVSTRMSCSLPWWTQRTIMTVSRHQTILPKMQWPPGITTMARTGDCHSSAIFCAAEELNDIPLSLGWEINAEV